MARSKPATPVVPAMTVEQRIARGRAARKEVARGDHAAWTAPAKRSDPVELLEKQGETRVPELVPLRYERMLASPFTFYRAAALLMANDLATLPRTTLITQICGDAHLSNFGAFAAPDRTLVFDVNDFDETLPGPFEWDLKRLAASFAIAGRDRGFGKADRKRINREVGKAYRAAMRRHAGSRNLDLWYSRISVGDILEQAAGRASKKQIARARKNVAKAQAKDSMRAFGKLTEVVDGELRIRRDPPAIVPIHELFEPEMHDALDEAIAALLASYAATLSEDRRRLFARFRYVDTARKVVGVGSVGTRAWIVLLLGRDDGDPLFLQVKEAEASVLEPYLGKSPHEQHGQRVVEGQRLMQGASDIMLGWVKTTGVDGVDRDYYVRQLWDQKGSALIELMNSSAMTQYATICGRTLARAHARGGDAVELSAYLGSSDRFDRALAAFAESYADQNEADYAAVTAAAKSGRISASSSS